MDLRSIGNEQLEIAMKLAADKGYHEVAEEIKAIYTDGDWDCMTDIPVIISRAYRNYIGSI